MSKYRQPLLKVLKPIWAKQLPDWQPGLFSPAFYTTPDATFSWTKSAAKTSNRYHLHIEFTPKFPSTFTGELFVSDGTQVMGPKNAVHRMPADLPGQKTGCYRIGHFILNQDRWRHLKDEVAESKQFWESRGLNPLSRLKRKKHDWYAASYDASPGQIMQEAAKNFTDEFVAHVLPKLVPVIAA